eukprot:SAG31_NODE_8_length_42345_cov_10.980992_14_plen_63_part_00
MVAEPELTPLRVVVLAIVTSMAAVLCYRIQMVEHAQVLDRLFRSLLAVRSQTIKKCAHADMG